jgi:hypothetical protein
MIFQPCWCQNMAMCLLDHFYAAPFNHSKVQKTAAFAI